MQDEGRNLVCRLCLNSCDCSFEDVGPVTIQMLGVVGLELDLNTSGKPVICNSCSVSLQKCFHFKNICLNNEDCIKSFRNDTSNLEFDLREIYLRKNENKYDEMPKCHTVCRLCMEIPEMGYMAINAETKNIMSVKTILGRYFSEIDLGITKHPVVCMSCSASLHSYFSFIKNCLDAANNIKQYFEIERSDGKPLEKTNNVLQFAVEKLSNEGINKTDIDIDIHINRKENEVDDDIKVKVENTMQEEPQQFHIKHEVIENEDTEECYKTDCFETVMVKPCYDSEQNGETDLKCEHFIKTESQGYHTEHKAIGVNTEDEEATRFEDNILIVKDALGLAMFQCRICKFETRHKHNLKKHLIGHKGMTRTVLRQCGKCAFMTKHKCCFYAHVLSHKNDSEVRMYQCNVCVFETKHEYALTRHTMLLHKSASEAPTYSCGNCTYQTKQKCSLKNHMLIHKRATESANPRAIYSYETKRKDLKKKGLKQHGFIHENSFEVTTYSCGVCAYKTRNKSNLDTHMLVHKKASEVTTYSCEVCTFKTKYKSNLSKHMSAHKNSSKLATSENSTDKTKQKSSLKPHTLIHKNTSEVTTFSCSICTYKTKRKSAFKGHMLTHKDISCEMCTYKAKRKRSLKRHIKLVHGNASGVTTCSDDYVHMKQNEKAVC